VKKLNLTLIHNAEYSTEHKTIFPMEMRGYINTNTSFDDILL